MHSGNIEVSVEVSCTGANRCPRRKKGALSRLRQGQEPAKISDQVYTRSLTRKREGYR